MNELRIGIVGAGGFAEFASHCFVKVPGIRITAVFDINGKAANEMAAGFSAVSYSGYESFLMDKQVDLVYIATPPYLHYSQSKEALMAGKHVICEKPAALKTTEAEELAALARGRKLLYVVDLMQRYNPLVLVVKDVIREKMLGEFLHGFFENYASDEKLTAEHWFWDEEKSGGIFIEHGVHFFDLFSGWLGRGEVIHAAQWQRPGTRKKIMDRVQAVVDYPDGPVNFYHGFDQPKILDRQEIRLQFERGDISLYEWVPVKIKLHGLLTDLQVEKLKMAFPGCSIIRHSGTIPGSDYASSMIEDTDSPAKNLNATGRFKKIEFDQFITLEYGSNAEKQTRYELLLTSMIRDQWNWLRDNSVERVIDDTNAVESLRMAERAKFESLKSLKV